MVCLKRNKIFKNLSQLLLKIVHELLYSRMQLVDWCHVAQKGSFLFCLLWYDWQFCSFKATTSLFLGRWSFLIGLKDLAILSFEEKMKMWTSLVLFLFVSVGAASALRVGVDHMRNPLINRGLATSPAERKLKGLSGLMPGQLFTLTSPPITPCFTLTNISFSLLFLFTQQYTRL